jgi:hypothetical protein
MSGKENWNHWKAFEEKVIEHYISDNPLSNVKLLARKVDWSEMAALSNSEK